MKSAVIFSSLIGLLTLTGCQTSAPDSLEAAARRQSQPVRIEFFRRARVYEEGDAFFAAVNDSRRLLWYDGRAPEAPAFRLKAGNFISDHNVPAARKETERFPLAPGDRCYFSVNASNAPGEISIGMTFYTFRTGTNAITVWSEPVALSVTK